MGGTFKISNSELEKLSKELKKYGEEKHEEGKKVNKKYAKKILREVIETVPVDTGNLKGSITSKSYKGGESIKIYTRSTAPYAVWVHEGHWTRTAKGKYRFKKRSKRRFIKGQPFMADALDKYKDDYIQELKNIAKK